MAADSLRRGGGGKHPCFLPAFSNIGAAKRKKTFTVQKHCKLCTQKHFQHFEREKVFLVRQFSKSPKPFSDRIESELEQIYQVTEFETRRPLLLICFRFAKEKTVQGNRCEQNQRYPDSLSNSEEKSIEREFSFPLSPQINLLLFPPPSTLFYQMVAGWRLLTAAQSGQRWALANGQIG